MVKEGVSTSFSLKKSLSSLYSGGGAEWYKDTLFTAADGKVNLVEKGEVLGKLEAEEDPIVSFTVENVGSSSDEPLAATCHKSGLVRLWTWTPVEEGKKELKTEVMRTFRSIHTGPISLCRLHCLPSGGKLLATGGTDGSVKVWDLTAQYYTHNLRAPGGGVASVITFHPSLLHLYAGFAGGGLFCWDLTTSRLAQTMTAHLSAVTGFAVVKDGSRAVSVGRDSVAVIWDLAADHKKLSTIPVFGPAEGLVLMDDGRAVVAEGSNLSVWDLSKAKQESKLDLCSEITLLREGGPDGLVHCANADLNLVTVTVPGLAVRDTVVGNNDEVLDLVYLGVDGSHLVLACNSPALRLYETSSWACHLASGHQDTVLALATSHADPTLLASGSKDRQVRVWKLSGGQLTCLLVGSGHTEALGGLAFSPDDPTKLWSVSKDTTLKAWIIGGDLTTTRTEIAHQKDINCVAVSQGGSQALVCTGGQDKLAKLWTGTDLRLVHVLRGHTRGVWTAAFSPVDKLVATGSGDSTVRLWSVGEGSCVRMLEGHQASVLRLAWWSGLQLVTASTEGLVKVWWVARQEATATIDTGEEGRVWALAVKPGENGLLEVTAGQAGGRVTMWRDDTVKAEEEKAEDAAKLVVSHQKLSNLLQEKKWGAAVRLALRLSQPFTALKIIKRLDIEDLQSAIDSLDMPGLDQLLGYTVKWNSNSRHCAAAQSVLNCVLTSRDSDDLIKLPGADTWLAGLIPYTEKHQARLSKLRRKGEFVPYLLHQMKATNLPLDSLAIAADRPEMGCDGGTIPTRDELVKLKKKPEQKDADAVRLLKWAHCALSQQVLAKKGVVACEMGRLYNKEAVIEMLLNKDRSTSPPWASHIEKLKDVVELDLTINPAYEAKRKDAVGDGMYQDKLVSRYQCPVTGLEMNGRFKFVFSWTTGSVVSERAMKVLRNDPDEADKFKEEDSVVINPNEEEIDEQIVKMEARRARVKAEKKAAKAAKKGIASAHSGSSGLTSAVSANDGFKRPGIPGAIQEVSSDQSLTEEPLAKKKKTEDDVKAFKDQGKGKKSKKEGEEKKKEESSSVPKKVFNPLAEQRRKEKEQDAMPAREGPKVKKADCRADGDLKAINKSSIQQGNKSEVFKKLFTSHESAQNLPKGHWVTFDPRYHF